MSSFVSESECASMSLSIPSGAVSRSTSERIKGPLEVLDLFAENQGNGVPCCPLPDWWALVVDEIWNGPTTRVIHTVIKPRHLTHLIDPIIVEEKHYTLPAGVIPQIALNPAQYFPVIVDQKIALDLKTPREFDVLDDTEEGFSELISEDVCSKVFILCLVIRLDLCNNWRCHMKLVAVVLFKWKAERPIVVSSHIDLSFFNMFVRSNAREHIVFHSRLVCERTPISTRQTVQFEQNLGNCHVYNHTCGLACTVITDAEYPQRVAFSLINQMINKFNEKYFSAWESVEEDTTAFPFPEGDELLKKYQNPMEADQLLKVQKELDEVKGVMLKNMDDLLQRGEKLDDLIQKTDDLSKTSREFYRSAKAQNQCCRLY